MYTQRMATDTTAANSQANDNAFRNTSQKCTNDTNVNNSISNGKKITNGEKTNTPKNCKPENPNPSSTIDSALISALSDSRERFALLRLEQTLVDFMNDATCGFMEVGGGFNSTVIRGASGGAAGESNTINSEVVESPSNNNTILSNNNLGNGNNNNSKATSSNLTDSQQHNPQHGGRQTSFQRLCLHRLADRFNIVRENNNAPLIRLVKVKNSLIPKSLLIDFDLNALLASGTEGNISRYAPSRNIDGSNGSGMGAAGSVPQDRGDGVDYRGLTDRLSATNLRDTPGNNTSKNSSMGGKRFKKKVMIMKRGKGSSGSLNNDTNNAGDPLSNDRNNRMKGKNLNDKEKAYAEARARIFNTSQVSSSTSSEVNQVTASLSNSNIVETLTVTEFLPNPTTESIISNTLGCNVTTDPTFSTDFITPKSLTVEINELVTSRSPSMLEMSEQNPDDSIISNTNYANYTNIPAGGVASKVTWRNRRQEESDPDFRRGHHAVMVSTIPINSVVTSPSNMGYATPHHHPHYTSGNLVVPGTLIHSGMNNGIPQHHISSSRTTAYHYAGSIDGHCHTMAYKNTGGNTYQHHNPSSTPQARVHGKVGNSLWQKQEHQDQEQQAQILHTTNSTHEIGQHQIHHHSYRKQQQEQGPYTFQQDAKVESHTPVPSVRMTIPSLSVPIANPHQESSPWSRSSNIDKDADTPAYSTDDFPALG